MDQETDGPRGAAAWQEQRAELAKRNLATKRQGQAERRAKERAVESRERVVAVQEAQKLDELNDQIAKRTASP
jgi:hypothetical protein